MRSSIPNVLIIPSPYDPVEGALPLAALSVTVMDVLRPIQTDADEEVVSLEGAPLLREAHPVGLQGILDLFLFPERPL
jgi:hypothetical protein